MFYGAGLVGYLANGISAWGYHVDHDIAAAVAIPVIAVLVSLALKRVRRKIGITGSERRSEAAPPPFRALRRQQPA